MGFKMEWDKYKERLIHYGYNEEEIEKVKQFIDESEHCPFEQFQFLFQQGIVKRTSKLKKPRNLYVKDGVFYYLNHFHKAFNYCGVFIENGE